MSKLTAIIFSATSSLALVLALVWLATAPKPIAAPVPPPPLPMPSATVVVETPTLIIEDRALLAQLEQRAFSIGSFALSSHTTLMEQRGTGTADTLMKKRAWHDVVQVLDADVRELYGKDKQYGVGMRFTHRAFDLSWLASAAVRFDLVAIVNRVDRRDFVPANSVAPSCGEVRFIYRAAYAVESALAGAAPLTSQLPMTINVVHLLMPAGDETCARAARSLDHLKAGPSGIQAFRPFLGPQKSFEVNLQSVRWPSTVRPDLGGHAEYVLRVFQTSADHTLVPAPLENTPDVDKLLTHAELAKDFSEWLRAPTTRAQTDTGVVIMPERFAAQRAVSVTPRGMARPQQRPFTRAAQRLKLDDVSREQLRKLDGMSCMGCHQSRSVAGFHMLGHDAQEPQALAIAHSPHVQDELKRRARWVFELLTAPRTPPSPKRPPAEFGRSSTTPGQRGDACARTLFSGWGCAEGLRCLAVDESEVGQCAPQSPGIGDACRPSPVDPSSDRVVNATELTCTDDALCEGIGVGFPGGMCAGSCDALTPGAVCGGIAILTPFNACLARGSPFAECAKHARPAGLAACDDEHPCRPDYLCASTERGAGACLPPYFVLPMRVDGHPLTPEPRWRRLLGGLKADH